MKQETNNKNIEAFVSKKFDECITEDNEEYVAHYLPFYSEIKNEQVRYLFAYLDCNFNHLFQYMNDKISSNNSYGGHYNAHESKKMPLLVAQIPWAHNTILIDKAISIIGNGRKKVKDNTQKLELI